MTPNSVALALTVAAALTLAWAWRAALRDWGLKDWLGGAVLVVGLVTFWRLIVTAVIGTLTLDWNGSRLAPTFALLYGYDLYYPADRGPVLNNVYGPVTALAFLPVAIFRTPTPAILAGGVLQDVFVLGSLGLFVWQVGRSLRIGGPMVLACALGACLLMARYWGTFYWISMVHADGPSLGFGLLACTTLITRDGATPTTRALSASALAVALAVWAKQTAAPLPLALVLAVWWGHGRAVGLRYLAYLTTFSAVISVLFLLWFGRPMIFNMFELVGRHGWYRPGWKGLAHVTGAWLRSIAELIAAGIVLLGVVWTTRSAAAPMRARPWIAPLLAIPLLLPAGALGANKLGGELSSFHSLYYLLALLAALLLDLVRRMPRLRLLPWVFCILGVAAAWHSGRCTPPASPVSIWDNSQQQAYEFALRHPGEAYFPWAPLASLLAEGKLYHFEYGMMDRFLGGFEVTRAHLEAHLPARLRWVAAHGNIWTFNRYFPDYTIETTLPELPGWTVRGRRE